MTGSEMVALLATIGTISYMVIEALKPWIKIYFTPLDELSDNAKALIYQLLNIVLCVGMVFLSGPELNLFLLNERTAMAGVIGQAFTGIAAGLGAKGVNLLMSFLTLRLVTIPTVEALRIKAEALKIVQNIPDLHSVRVAIEKVEI